MKVNLKLMKRITDKMKKPKMNNVRNFLEEKHFLAFSKLPSASFLISSFLNFLVRY